MSRLPSNTGSSFLFDIAGFFLGFDLDFGARLDFFFELSVGCPVYRNQDLFSNVVQVDSAHYISTLYFVMS